MAHKHNRRRVRPRGRNYNYLNSTVDILDNVSASSFNSCTPFPSSPTDIRQKQTPLPPGLRNPSAGIASWQWYNRYATWQNRESSQKREAFQIEAEQIKLFGGEPGDDVGLCYKMMEVFEGMNWIDTME